MLAAQAHQIAGVPASRFRLAAINDVVRFNAALETARNPTFAAITLPHQRTTGSFVLSVHLVTAFLGHAAWFRLGDGTRTVIVVTHLSAFGTNFGNLRASSSSC